MPRGNLLTRISPTVHWSIDPLVAPRQLASVGLVVHLPLLAAGDVGVHPGGSHLHDMLVSCGQSSDSPRYFSPLPENRGISDIPPGNASQIPMSNIKPPAQEVDSSRKRNVLYRQKSHRCPWYQAQTPLAKLRFLCVRAQGGPPLDSRCQVLLKRIWIAEVLAHPVESRAGHEAKTQSQSPRA